MSLNSTLNIYLEIGAIILSLIFIVGFLNLYVPFPKKLKFFLSSLIIVVATIWLLNDLGILNSIINPVSNWVRALK